MIHELKIRAEFFEAKKQGIKPWEIRIDDRKFKVGDLVCYMKILSNGTITTMSMALKHEDIRMYSEITYIFKDNNFLQDGLCIFSERLMNYDEFQKIKWEGAID